MQDSRPRVFTSARCGLSPRAGKNRNLQALLPPRAPSQRLDPGSPRAVPRPVVPACFELIVCLLFPPPPLFSPALHEPPSPLFSSTIPIGSAAPQPRPPHCRPTLALVF